MQGMRTTMVLCALLAALAGAQAADETVAASAPRTRSATHTLSVTGVVTGLDLTDRHVTVRNDQGRVSTYAVDPSMRNLQNLKVGDRVRLDYTLAIALSLRKGGDGIRERVESQAQAQTQGGNVKPGVAATRNLTLVADVEAVNRTKKTVRLRGPSGGVVDLLVEDKAVLEDVKPGDQVEATIQEAMAVNVRPAAPAASK